MFLVIFVRPSSDCRAYAEKRRVCSVSALWPTHKSMHKRFVVGCDANGRISRSLNGDTMIGDSLTNQQGTNLLATAEKATPTDDK